VKTGNSIRIREYARREYIEPARRRGEVTVRIVAGEVEKALGLQSRAAQVCSALRADKFLKESRLAIEKVEGPPKKMSTTTKFTYRLLDVSHRKKVEADPVLALSGAAKGLFDKPGDWEAAIRYDREHFYGDERDS
jgi:hypothetical protein